MIDPLHLVWSSEGLDLQRFGAAVWERLVPEPAVTASPLETLGLLAVVLALVTVGPLWRSVRVVVTLVHELGHAFVGMLFGRRFTGFVIRGDMSGHAVTVGRATGPGIVVTTWAGYPAPILVGTAFLGAVALGWSSPMLFAVLLALVLALPRVRSVATLGVLVFVAVAVGALWWSAPDLTRELVVSGAALVLIVGGWRHLLGVRSRATRGSGSDLDALARLTGVPAAACWASMVLVALAACAAPVWNLYRSWS